MAKAQTILGASESPAEPEAHSSTAFSSLEKSSALRKELKVWE